VHFQSEVLEVSDNGKMIALRVQAFDDAGLIGEGTHKRAIVRRIYFEEKALKKSFPQARK
jgi:predicted thioesterase